MNVDVVQVAAGFLIAQILGAVLVVAVLKADSKWIKHMLQDHETRLRRVERQTPGVRPTEFDSLDSLGV